MNKRQNQKELREFGILIGLVFPILIGLVIPLLMGHAFRQWTLFIAIPSLFLSIIRPKLLQIPYIIWIRFGLILGWINSRIILSIVFIAILLPTAFIMKIFGYDPLRFRKVQCSSYKEPINELNNDLSKPF